MKIRIISVALLLLIAACGGDDKEHTFHFLVHSGEGLGGPVEGANIEVYSSFQSWIDGTPLKTYVSDKNGQVDSFDEFTGNEFIFVEKENFNNWPNLGELIMESPPAGSGIFNGGTTLYSTFLQDFEAVEGKSFLLTDVLVNNVSTFGSVAACSKDNFIKLTLESKFTYNEGANVCIGESAIVTSDVYLPQQKSAASEVTISTVSYYNFQTNWSVITNGLYINEGFNKILTREYSGANEVINIYTLQ